MTSPEIKLLQRYRVDRADGTTAKGPEKLVILVLKTNSGPEVCVAISKIDAMIIAHQLTNAAVEVRDA